MLLQQKNKTMTTLEHIRLADVGWIRERSGEPCDKTTNWIQLQIKNIAVPD